MNVPFRFKDLPIDSGAKYLLNVFMPMPFGMGKNTFLVDDVDTVARTGTVSTVRGTKDGKLVVEFPDSFHFMLIDINQFDALTPEQIAEEEKKYQESQAKQNGAGDEELLSPGRFTHL